MANNGMKCHRIVDFVTVIYYIKDNIPVRPLLYSKLNYDGSFYLWNHGSMLYKADILSPFINDVRSIKHRISDMLIRFSAMMGVPVHHEIGMCCEVE
jgi:hypothetical protein